MNCQFHANWAQAEGGGLWCQSKSSPTLSDCLFRGNVAKVGGGLSVAEGQPVITNCIFEHNEAEYGAGLASRYMGHPLVSHCTFSGNQSPNGAALYIGYLSLGTVKNCILWNHGREIVNDEDSSFDITFSGIKGHWPGQGNIDVDPLFAVPGHWVHSNDPNLPVESNDPNAVWVSGDYHLKSKAGRWILKRPVEPNSASGSWVFDDVTSPCIDAGDPNMPVTLEPSPNGGIVNMGAYGQTEEASKSALDLVSGASQYRFISNQSTLVQTGGFAGVNWTHVVEGHFVIDVDLNAGTAAFLQVDANAMDQDFPDRVLDPNTALNMTNLTGVIDHNGSIRFSGQAANEVSVDLQITTLEQGLIHLTGRTTPPPGSADFFILTLDAHAQRMYGNITD